MIFIRLNLLLLKFTTVVQWRLLLIEEMWCYADRLELVTITISACIGHHGLLKCDAMLGSVGSSMFLLLIYVQ